jgi:hypothetical protein
MTIQTDTQLRRLIYVSAASSRFPQAELDQILAVSRSNNSARGLTGMLLFHDGCFFQVLEGDADTIERTFATISRDTRHSGVIILESRAIDERGFPQWSMGYVGAHTLHPAQRDWLVDLSARVATDDPAPLSDVARVNVHIESFLSTFREFA